MAVLRLERNLTQAALAAAAGVSTRTVGRLEAGEVATQLSGFVRVCRALGLIERFELLVPEPLPSPLAQLESRGKTRKRASGKTATTGKARAAGRTAWTWGEDT